MKRWAIILLILVVAPSVAWGQRSGTTGQAGEWNAAHISGVTHLTLGLSPALTTAVSWCNPSLLTVLSPSATRREVQLQNVGTVPIYIGGAHATLTAATGFAIHASSVSAGASRLTLRDFRGRLDCITDSGPTQNQKLDILEIVR